ncbi:MAG: glycosyltransferase family 4 protein [Nitriliruptoraceae bacterium]|nr:glycosyltransferase family 4 protein [Nitriliruptoraceae bacterium]
MDITYFGPLPPHPGGIAQHGHNLAEGLSGRGNRVQRLSWRTLYPPRLYPGRTADRGRPPHERNSELADWWAPSSWVRAGWRAAAGDALVVPWVTAFHAPAVISALAAAQGTRRILVVHNARPHERHPGDTAALRTALHLVDGVLCHADAIRDDVRELAPGMPCTVVAHPPNLPLTPGRPPPTEPLRVLVFGYVRAYKGVEDALVAVRAAADRGASIELTIAGEFWEPIERWEELLRRQGLTEQVVLRPGYVPDAEVAELFASHHLLLAPYRSATQSGTIPLARAAGRPVVATDVGGLGEAVADGLDGRLVPPQDPGAMADAMLEVRDGFEAYRTASQDRRTDWGHVAEAVTALMRR